MKTNHMLVEQDDFQRVYSLHAHGQQRDPDHDQIQDVKGVTTE